MPTMPPAAPRIVSVLTATIVAGVTSFATAAGPVESLPHAEASTATINPHSAIRTGAAPISAADFINQLRIE